MVPRLMAASFPDRYVVGNCPHCGYAVARGDHCDGCARLLDPTDLVSPRSALSDATELQIRESNHLFLAAVGSRRAPARLSLDPPRLGPHRASNSWQMAG